MDASNFNDISSNFSATKGDDKEHWLKCWSKYDCGHCLAKSSDNCGWCPYSATCVPLPKNGHLLSPVHDSHICPMWQERFELRTQTFGCNCSTTSFLVSLATVFITIAALLLLYLLVTLIKWARLAAQGRKGGWELHVEDDGPGQERRWGHVWIRKSESIFHRMWRGATGEKTMEEMDKIDEERTPLLAGDRA